MLIVDNTNKLKYCRIGILKTKKASSLCCMRRNEACIMHHYYACLFSMTVGTLFAILRFLPRRTATMGSSDIFLLLGLGLHLAVIGLLSRATSTEDDATPNNDCVNIVAFAQNYIIMWGF